MKCMTISVTEDFQKLLDELVKITSLKKSTIIRLAVIEWAKRYRGE